MAQKRPLRSDVKKRERSRYDPEKHGKLRTGSQVPANNKTLNLSVCQMKMVFPPSDGGKLRFRVLNPLDPQDPQNNLLSSRTAEGRWTEWGVKVPTVRWVGVKTNSYDPLTWCLCHPDDINILGATNPYVILRKKCMEAMGGDQFPDGRMWNPEWAKLMPPVDKKQGFQKRAMVDPDSLWFYQAAILDDGSGKGPNAGNYTTDERGILGFRPDDPLCVVEVSQMCGVKLCELLNRVREDADPEEEDLYFYPDVVGHYNRKKGVVDGGMILSAYKPTAQSKPSKHTTYDGKFQGKQQGYQFELSKAYGGRGAALSVKETDIVRQKAQYFFDDPDDDTSKGIILIAPPEEQAEWVAMAFQGFARMLLSAWADKPEFRHDGVMAILKARKSVGPDGSTDEASEEDEEEDGEEEEEVEAPRVKKKAKKLAPHLQAKKAKKRPVEEEEELVDFPPTEDEDEVEEEETPRVKKRKPRPADEDEEFDTRPPAGKKSRKTKDNDAVYDNEEFAEEEEEPASDEEIAEQFGDLDDDGDDDDDDAPPARPAKAAPKTKVKKPTKGGEEDLDDDDRAAYKQRSLFTDVGEEDLRDMRKKAKKAKPKTEEEEVEPDSDAEAAMTKSAKAVKDARGRASARSGKTAPPPPPPRKKRPGG
jgi:hypothetical protein